MKLDAVTCNVVGDLVWPGVSQRFFHAQCIQLARSPCCCRCSYIIWTEVRFFSHFKTLLLTIVRFITLWLKIKVSLFAHIQNTRNVVYKFYVVINFTTYL